jgi:hypothetical protein
MMTGKDIKKIPYSIDKTKMMHYCGPNGLTVQQYRDENRAKIDKINRAIKSSIIETDII